MSQKENLELPNRHSKKIRLKTIALMLFLSLPGLSASASDKGLQVEKLQKGKTVSIYLSRCRPLEASIVLTYKLENSRASTSSPALVQIKNRKPQLLSIIQPINQTQAWRYNYHYEWKVGVPTRNPRIDHVYELPFESGKSYKVSQGYLGKRTHSDQYAVDFSMPEGTPICAAWGGTVIDVKNDSTEHGDSEEFKDKANHIMIRHEDGTYALYNHLKLNGPLVKTGQQVRTGDKIGLSGNTGYTSGPHLHFHVFQTEFDGKEIKYKTLPITFKTKEGRTNSPKQGAYYTR